MLPPELLDSCYVARAVGQRDGACGGLARVVPAFATEVGADLLGSSWARVPGTAGGPTLAIVGHIDEIGVHVTHIEDEGFLRFGQVGGWDPVQLVGQRIVLDTRGGPVYGVIGRKPIHLLKDEDRKKRPELKELHIDIGAATATRPGAGADR